MSKITAYVLNYNYVEYVEKCIQSIYLQSINEFKLIVIDDASSDGSIELLIKLRDQYGFDLILNQTNRGLIRNSNTALKKADTDYIIRIDADDFLCVDAFERLLNAAEADPSISLVYGNYYLTDPSGQVIAQEKYSQEFSMNSVPNYPAHGAVSLIKVADLKEIGGYSTKYTKQDGYYIWFCFIKKNKKMLHIDEPIFYYTQHSKSLSFCKKTLLETRSKILTDLDQSVNVVNYFSSLINIEHLIFEENDIGHKLRSLILLEIKEAEGLFEEVTLFTRYPSKMHKIFSDLNPDIFEYGNASISLLQKIKNKLKITNIKSNTVIIRNFEYPFLEFHHILGAIALKNILGVTTVLSCVDLLEEVFMLDRGRIKPMRGFHMPSIERDKQKLRAGGLIITNTSNCYDTDIFANCNIVGYDIDEFSGLSFFSKLRHVL